MAMDKNPAMSRMMINGSENFSKNCFHNGSFSGGVRMFTPCFVRLSNTCASVKPVYLSVCCIMINIRIGASP